MNLSILNIVKYNPIVYKIYNSLGSFLLRIVQIFVKTDPDLIIFVSYGGRKFDDSPKAIYEEMTRDVRFSSKKFLWAFLEPDSHNLSPENKINISSFKYFIKLLKARVWITNSSVERGLSIRCKNTFYLNTWHGSPIKKMGADINKGNNSFSKKDGSVPNVMLSQSDFEVDIFSRVFQIPRSIFEKTGLPRNDELVNGNNIDNIKRLKRKIGIPEDKKVILYAPTFREYEKDNLKNCVFTAPLNFKLWEKELSSDYCLLIRAHYEISKKLDFQDSDTIRNVSDYDSLNELMLVSDILVSDYSSIFFDFSILERPMLAFCYDYELYASKRGMYFDIRETLDSWCTTEKELLSEIKNINISERIKIASNFKKKYIELCGNATKKCCDIIAKNII